MITMRGRPPLIGLIRACGEFDAIEQVCDASVMASGFIGARDLGAGCYQAAGKISRLAVAHVVGIFVLNAGVPAPRSSCPSRPPAHRGE